MAAVGDGAGVDVPDAEPCKMMMHAARRRAVERLDLASAVRAANTQ